MIETGIAKVHKGEVFSGTNNEMGFGATDMRETVAELKKVQKALVELAGVNSFHLTKVQKEVSNLKLQNT